MPALTLSLTLLMLVTPSELHAQVREPWREDIIAITSSPPATVAAIALSIRSRAIQDSRCYLMNGGAVESFFVSEDLPVGSVIGTLSVNGDPDEERGDITLRVQEKGAAVAIAAGTKNLTLLRPLDREERLGPSNVYVNVRCDRRLTTDPSFIIPVSVRVWDVNDNAPVWAGAPYRVRLSELTAPGSRVLTGARAADADQPGPHATIRYSVLPGPHSEYFAFANELDSVLVVQKALDYESLPNMSLTLRAEDHGSPALHGDAQLHVEVLDADDQNPKFSHDHYTALLPDDAVEGTVLETSPGPISAVDQDVGINAPLHYSATGDLRGLVTVHRDTGALAVAAARLLRRAAPATLVIKAVQVDNPDRYALATVTVSVAGAAGGSPAVRFTRAQYAAAVSEAAAPGTVLLTLHTEPAPSADSGGLQFFVSERGFLDKFAINGAGEVVLRRALDYETADCYRYQVMVTDGVANDTASLDITVENVNEWEPRFRYPQYEFRVEPAEPPAAGAAEGAAGGLLPVGKLDVFDGDKADSVTLTLKGSDAGMFYINSSGDMFLRQEALPVNSSVLHVVATAVDSGNPPRQTSVPVIVHVSGRAAGARGAAGGAPVLAALGAALALLALLLCALLLYLQRRRSKSSPSPSSTGGGVGGGGGGGKPYLAHDAARSASPPAAPALGGSGSLQSVSAGASTILANSSSSLDLRDTLPTNGINPHGSSGRQSTRTQRSKVAPLPPALPSPGAGAGPGAGAAAGAGVSLMSDHVGGAGGGGRSGVAWPSSTIPARVKKLSWDDASTDNKDSAEGAHGGSPLAPPPAEHMNLTVYF